MKFFAFLLSLSIPIFTYGIDRELLHEFFLYLGCVGNSRDDISLEAVEAFMTTDCVVESNKEILSRNTQEFIDYMHRMQNKYSYVAYSDVLENLITYENKIGLRFTVDCTEVNGEKYKLDVCAVATFKEGKIAWWQEFFAKDGSEGSAGDFLLEGYLPVSELHMLFYRTYGNPLGIPVVVLHGGPGEGCSELLLQFFDLKRYYLVMFDQRGSGRSIPFGVMEENTPHHSVEDIEKLRKHLGVDKWLIFGGSWGSTLAILYGKAYSGHCLGFILRGVFLGREKDYLHLFYGMGRLSPREYLSFTNFIPQEERSDLFSAYYRRVMDSDPSIHTAAALKFMEFDLSCSRVKENLELKKQALEDKKSMYCIAKHFFQYAKNRFFLEQEPILSRIEKIAYLPMIIVQGSQDKITPSAGARMLHEKWSNSAFWRIEEGGHTSIEPEMSRALQNALMLFADLLE